MMFEKPRSPLDDCQSIAELLLIAHRLEGREVVERLIVDIGLCKQSLRRALGEYRRIGLTELAAIVASAAKTAPQGWLTFDQRRQAQIRRQKRRLAQSVKSP
jgi:hypothetical protein